MERGEVWLVALPFASGGREQTGHRPAVVIQDSTYGAASPLVFIVPLTSQLAVMRFPGTIRIEPSTGNGLSIPSAAMIFQMRAVDRTRFVRWMGGISDADLNAILAELDKLTGR